MSNNLKKSQTAQFTEDVTVQVQDWRDDLTDILEQRESFFYEAENCVDLIERINEISKFYPFGSYVRRYLYRNYLPKTIDQPFRKIKESVFLEELKQLLQEYKKTNPSFPVTNQTLKTWRRWRARNTGASTWPRRTLWGPTCPTPSATWPTATPPRSASWERTGRSRKWWPPTTWARR